MSFVHQFIQEQCEILQALDQSKLEEMAVLLSTLKKNKGRLFILGVGGSAANCSHAVNDFRKIVGIEAYAPTDNVAEITARTNDEGWASVFVEWLKVSCLNEKDIILILSVGGGSIEKNISYNLIKAIDYGLECGAKILGILGRDGGYTAKNSTCSVIIPTVNPENITPHAESLQAVISHLLVSHPLLKHRQTMWESAA